MEILALRKNMLSSIEVVSAYFAIFHLIKFLRLEQIKFHRSNFCKRKSDKNISLHHLRTLPCHRQLFIPFAFILCRKLSISGQMKGKIYLLENSLIFFSRSHLNTEFILMLTNPGEIRHENSQRERKLCKAVTDLIAERLQLQRVSMTKSLCENCQFRETEKTLNTKQSL